MILLSCQFSLFISISPATSMVTFTSPASSKLARIFSAFLMSHSTDSSPCSSKMTVTGRNGLCETSNKVIIPRLSAMLRLLQGALGDLEWLHAPFTQDSQVADQRGEVPGGVPYWVSCPIITSAVVHKHPRSYKFNNSSADAHAQLKGGRQQTRD